MSLVSSLYVRKAIAQADPSLNPADLFAIVGMDPDEPPNVERMVQADDYRKLFSTLAQGDGERISFHIRTGASMRCEDMGALGLSWKSSKTLLDGFERAGRYIRLLIQPRQIFVEQADDETRVTFEEPSPETSVGEKLSNEASFATITSLARESSNRPFAPLRVLCAHKFVGDKQVLEDFLQCTVTDDAGVNSMIMSTEDVLTPNLLGDDALSKFFDDHLMGKLREHDVETSIDQRVRTEIARSLSAGVPKISDIAQAMGMGPRTLQRRLGEEGLVYQTLVDEARRQLAERLLRTTKYPLVEVAFLTGFAEQSGFTRAFKRWAGQTPRSYRLAASS